MDNIYLAVPPDSVSEALKTGHRLAYMTYRISKSGKLYRANCICAKSGGIMYIDDSGPVAHNHELPKEIVRECKEKHFYGVVLDISGCFSREMVEAIADACREHNIMVYVPRVFANCKNTICLIPTGISSGSLASILHSAIAELGAERVAMALDFVRIDYTLPAKEENGISLTEQQLSTLVTNYRSPSFYSKELCTYYFTYRSSNRAHLVLYDNAVSMKRKLILGESLGINTGFLFYPHVRGMLSRILDN